jgi:signal transduction histidine kinase
MYKLLPINYTLILLFIAVSGHAQLPTQIDSFWKAYYKADVEADKIEPLNALSSAYIYNNADSAIILLGQLRALAISGKNDTATADYYQKIGLAYHKQTRNELAVLHMDSAIMLSRQIGDSIRVAQNLINKGVVYQQSGDFESSIRVQDKVIRMMSAPGGDRKILAKALNNNGINFFDLGLQKQALDYLFQALDISLELNNAVDLVNTYCSIANIYQEREEYDKALEYYAYAGRWVAETGSEYHKALININLGANFIGSGDLPKADSVLHIAERITTSINNPVLLMYTRLNQADIAYKRGAFERAEQILLNARRFCQKNKLPYGEGNSLYTLAEIKSKQKDYNAAIAYTQEALAVFEIHQLIEDLADAQRLMASIYEKNGEYSKALAFNKKYQAFQDSVFTIENSKVIAGLHLEHEIEMEEKELQLQLTEKQKALEAANARAQQWYLLAMAVIALLLLVILGLLLYNFRKQQNAKKELGHINKELYDANEKLEIAYLDLASTNQQLNMANNKLQQFAFAASHDLKESLRNMTTYSQLVAKKLNGANNFEHVRKYLNQIIDSGRGMYRLLGNLLEFAEGPVDAEDSTVLDLEVMVQTIKSTWKHHEAFNDIEFKIDSELPLLSASAPQIEQLFTNLIDNAIKFRKPKEKLVLKIGVKEIKNRAVFYVKDNGIGIEPNFHDRIFAPFFRLHGRHISGSGMGLPIAKRIVESYQGSIWVESKANVGTTFFFTLPSAVYAARKIAN